MDKLITIFKLLPVIISAIKAVEDVIPGQGQGEKKLVAVREMLEAVDTSIAAIWPQISSLIAVLVKTMTASGVLNANTSK